jgi:hypothetical protein
MVVLAIVGMEDEVRWRQSIELIAMKREIEMMARNLLRDIVPLVELYER